MDTILPGWLSLIDIAVVAIVLLMALGGLQKGFASQVAHILTMLGMGLFLFLAYPPLFTYMGRLFRNMDQVYMVWLLVLGLVALAVVFFIYISKLLANVLKLKITDRTDRFYGFVLGAVRGILFILITMILLVILGPDKFYSVFSDKSQAGQLVCYEMVPRIQPHFNKDTVGDGIDRMREALIYQEEAGLPDE